MRQVMWVRRTEQETESIVGRRQGDAESMSAENVRRSANTRPWINLAKGILVSLLCALFGAALVLFKFTPVAGPDSRIPHFDLTMPKKMPAPEEMTLAILVAIAFFIIGLFSWYGKRLVRKPQLHICNRCQMTKMDDGQPTCHCGGTFEHIDLWRWEKEQKP